MNWRIAIDIGGTFTDVVALNEQSGEIEVAKVPSSPAAPAKGFMAGIEEIVRTARVQQSDISGVFHGTTVATNAILEHKYATMGLIITRGYREALECGRQTVPGEFGDITWWVKPPRVVPLERVREIDARTNVSGEITRPVDREQARAIAREFKELNIRAIAVSLLHSYRNPVQEQEVRDAILEEYPECYVSISSDILREYREYERTNTTCLNTALMPLLSAYHDELSGHLKQSGIDAQFYIMRSSGGLAKADEISRLPIAAALSGPAAGVIAATHFGRLGGEENIIAFDVGGTSADICLVENGTPRMLTEGKVDIYDVKTPMVDIHTVGAGGGSIAWLAGGRSLKVGPESAGSDPGPVCYNRGGTQPTTTDANLVLGRITPELAGGSLVLDYDAALASIQALAEQLGLDAIAAADGILRIAIENMAAGIRTVSVKRGRDPRKYALVAFGGGGPVYACYLADWLGMSTIIVPPNPGVTSAYGLLLTDVRIDLVHTNVQREDSLDLQRVASEFATLETNVGGRLEAEGFSGERQAINRFIDMRYAGQAYEIRIAMDAGAGAIEAQVFDAIARFHVSHKDLYGHSYEGSEFVEVVNLGVTGLGLLERPATAASAGNAEAAAPAVLRTVRTHFPGHGGAMDCQVYDRAALLQGHTIQGPAIVQQYDTTTIINPGWAGTVDEWGILKLRATKQASA